MVAAGNWPTWLICSGAGCSLTVAMRRQRHLAAAGAEGR